MTRNGKIARLPGLNRDLALLQKTLQQVSRQKRDSEQALDERIEREEEAEKKRLVAPAHRLAGPRSS